MTSSGTLNFSPSISDILIESFERIQIRSAEITPEHMYSAKASCNLVLSSWMNRGVNLWKVTQNTIPMVQGVGTYNLPASTVMVLDTYVRQYSMNGANNVTLPAFATTLNSPTVTVTQANNGMSVGNYISIVIPVSIGGLILYGFYQVTSTPSSSIYTFTAASNATSTVASGGVVPYFTSVANSPNINVLLPNHGYVAGGTFVIQVTTNVGGIPLFGSYTISAIVDANNFTISPGYNAAYSGSIYENAGMAQIALQQVSSQPVDRIMTPISRTDYASLANKFVQGFSSVYWFDRLLTPTVTLWQIPDGNGPYALVYYAATQIFDANPQNGQTSDMPNRFLEAFCCEWSYHLARKWKPEMEAMRKADYLAAWAEAAAEDRERVPMYVMPVFDSYFQ
jgi:hypothetical protein